MSNRLPRSGTPRIDSLGSSHEFYKGVQMSFPSVDPATGEKLREYPEWDTTHLDKALDLATHRAGLWGSLEVGERCKKLRELAGVLKRRRDEYAEIISREMGKVLAEARGVSLEEISRQTTENFFRLFSKVPA